MTIDLGRTNSIDVLADRVTLAGRSIADVACGGMAFSRLLAENQGNVTQAARQCGLERQSLQQIMRRFGIKADDYRK